MLLDSFEDAVLLERCVDLVDQVYRTGDLADFADQTCSVRQITFAKSNSVLQASRCFDSQPAYETGQ